MQDLEREYAIQEAGKALEDAQAHYERCKAAYGRSGCFGHAAEVDTARAGRDEARRYMEALIRGRSPAQVRHMERERGLA